MTASEEKQRLARALFYCAKSIPGGATWSMLHKPEKARWLWIAEVVIEHSYNFSHALDRLENIARINR